MENYGTKYCKQAYDVQTMKGGFKMHGDGGACCGCVGTGIAIVVVIILLLIALGIVF